MPRNKLLDAAGCEIRVVCGKKWSDLDETEQDGIRFCGECKKRVIYTKTTYELKSAAEKKLCVYIDSDSSSQPSENFNAPTNNFVVTRERIRQIEAKALSRMRRPLMGHAIIRQDLNDEQ